MSIQIIPKAQQGKGAFNGGEILENKPIGFPQDNSKTRPYSNLFYWAHARAVTDSTIGLHPHQGFEICSFVLKGEIRHYDTKLKEWRPLSAGDVQIIRSGNGISHSEWMGKDSEMFQIWFDPNLQKTLSQPASYDDYKAAGFPEKSMGDAKVKVLVGEGSPFTMDTPGVEVLQIELENGSSEIPVNESQTISAYLLDGSAEINGELINTTDFCILDNVSSMQIKSDNSAKVFVIISPAKLDYPTYSQLRFG